MTTPLDELPRIGTPATRALQAAGFTCLEELAGVPDKQLLQLHGGGPKAIAIIQAALEEHQLALS